VQQTPGARSRPKVGPRGGDTRRRERGHLIWSRVMTVGVICWRRVEPWPVRGVGR
jgi:hypothetical protein